MRRGKQERAGEEREGRESEYDSGVMQSASNRGTQRVLHNHTKHSQHRSK